MNLLPFVPYEINNNLAAGAASSSITFTGGGINAGQLLIANVGNVEAFVVWGVAPQIATVQGQSIPPGAIMMFTKPDQANCVAAITSGGTTNLRISAGSGT